MRQRSSVIFFWCALALILIVRGRAMWALSDGLRNDPDGYRQLANSLQGNRDEYGRSEFLFYRGDGNVIAYRPPLYPWLLSWGLPANSANFPMWVGGVQLLLGFGTVLLVRDCARRWQLTEWPANLAALLVLIDPLLVRQASEMMTETLATCLAVGCLWSLSWTTSEKVSVKSALFSGVLIGTSVLCRPTFLTWGLLLIPALLVIEMRRRLVMDNALILCAGLAIAMLPWGIRNTVHFGKPIWTTTHGGYTFYRANNPLYYEHLRSRPFGTIWTSNQFDANWRLRRMSTDGFVNTWKETHEDKLAYSKALQTIDEEPGMFLYACIVRLERFYGMVPWQTDPNESARGRWLRYGIGVFYFFEFALAIVGVCALGRKLFAPPWIWGTLLVVSFTLVHTFYWTDMRMRAPIVPVIAMLAAVGAGWVWSRLRPAGELALPA